MINPVSLFLGQKTGEKERLPLILRLPFFFFSIRTLKLLSFSFSRAFRGIDYSNYIER
jgi:hypothetical protein